ncbi:MAG: plasmid recombination protein [Bacilli bacterium]|nr:plasmid recombination protein [Bacilli bacterium]
MDIDYQVLRFENHIKKKDIGGLGAELTKRKGSGNYDKDRSIFNIEYVGLDGQPTLSSKVYEMIYKNDIHFNKGNNTNILNGCIVTSGPDFFRKLGLPMKDSGRVYIDGKHAGETIYCPDIKSSEDVPKKVLKYFDESFKFLSDLVGNDNVVYSAVHFDEDTPHMHFYFLPIVDKVKRKVFETDSSGKRITKEIFTKDGKVKKVPIQKKDENGRNVYETVHGKFLNTDEFWKQLGGKTSFAKIQDEYNDYINSKGFNLDRGIKGANRHHQSKSLHNIKVLQNELRNLKEEIEINKSINENEKNTNKELLNLDVIKPSKDIFRRYKDKDVERLIDYNKEVKKENILFKNEITRKEIIIDNLESQISKFKSGKVYLDKVEIIQNQEEIINKQKGIIDSLNEEVRLLKEKLNKVIKVFQRKLNNAYLAISHLLGFDKHESDLIERNIYKINKKHEKSARGENDLEI